MENNKIQPKYELGQFVYILLNHDIRIGSVKNIIVDISEKGISYSYKVLDTELPIEEENLFCSQEEILDTLPKHENPTDMFGEKLNKGDLILTRNGWQWSWSRGKFEAKYTLPNGNDLYTYKYNGLHTDTQCVIYKEEYGRWYDEDTKFDVSFRKFKVKNPTDTFGAILNKDDEILAYNEKEIHLNKYNFDCQYRFPNGEILYRIVDYKKYYILRTQCVRYNEKKHKGSRYDVYLRAKGDSRKISEIRFMPFEKVLVRNTNSCWKIDFFCGYCNNNTYKYVTTKNKEWQYCMPYNNCFEYLVGTQIKY